MHSLLFTKVKGNKMLSLSFYSHINTCFKGIVYPKIFILSSATRPQPVFIYFILLKAKADISNNMEYQTVLGHH